MPPLPMRQHQGSGVIAGPPVAHSGKLTLSCLVMSSSRLSESLAKYRGKHPKKLAPVGLQVDQSQVVTTDFFDLPIVRQWGRGLIEERSSAGA